MEIRKRAAVAFAIGGVVVMTSSAAFACVTFKGQMTVDGHDGDTTVVGHGTEHAYCTGGEPATAAAGHVGDNITIRVSPQSCPGTVAGNDRLPDGTYEVRYNNRESYAFDGTSYVMVPLSGCFFTGNVATTSTIGTFNITGGTGTQTWTGPINPISPAGVPAYSAPGTASNICVGKTGTYLPTGNDGGPPGMLAPYRLLAI